MMERTVLEKFPNGSMAVTTIMRLRKQSVIVYDVWLVGRRGWRRVVPILPHNQQERRRTALEQERIAATAMR